LSTKEFAIKQYNWKGQIVAYLQENTWIPVGGHVWRSQEIEESIRNGECILLEPEITLVYEVYGENEEWRGYLWNDTFVPNDENNSLFNVIKNQIHDKTCQVRSLPSILFMVKSAARHAP